MKATDIIKIRIRLGLSQEEFANLLGVHQTTVSKWELGGTVRGPAYKLLLQLKKGEAA